MAAFHGRSAEAVARTWAARGVEVVLRHADHRIEVVSGGGAELFPPEAVADRVVDATGAGDSFNGTYLAARFSGADPAAAAAAAHRVAGIVVGHRGALVDPALIRQATADRG